MPPSAKLFRLSHVQKLRECEQVAAVCYWVREGNIEFLLVRTRNGHWTFPKGGVEPGLTHAQAAALEAFEEAGVHGRMEETSFTRYVRRRGRRGSAGDARSEVGTSAHLCEVLRLVQPQESDRSPTWFSVERAKKKLLEGRPAEFAVELIRVVDGAVAQIRRLSQTLTESTDAIRQVQFEAVVETSEQDRTREFADSRLMRSSKAGVRGDSRAKVLQIGPALVVNAVTMKQLSGARPGNPAPVRKLGNGKTARRVARASFNASKKRD